MSSQPQLAGLVLAGGFSTRFGDRDKAIAPLGGTPMIRRVVDRIGDEMTDVIVNCRDEQVPAIREALDGCEPSVRFAIDEIPDRGPIGGIRDGLSVINAEYTAVVACDMPFVDPSLLAILADRAVGHDGAIVQLDDGWYQTTQAVYRTEPMRDACKAVLDSGGGRILAALESLDVHIISEDVLEREGISNQTFEGIDTQQALRTAERRL